MPVALTASDSWEIALAVFLILTGVALAWAFVSLAGTLRGLTAFLAGTQEEALPMIHEVGGTIKRVNVQLDKLDKVTDSAVDAASSADAAVRAVSHVVTAPIRKVSSVAAGIRHGTASFKARRGWSESVHTGKEAAARQAQDVDDELRGTQERG
jgi:uncharacterized protein YoxC